MHESVLLLTLTFSLAAALVLGYLTQRLGLSPIVGYLLAGLIVGPYTPGFVADPSLASEFAEIGIILLMFGVGLHFHPKDLLAVRNIAIGGALSQSALATLFGALLGHRFGWSWSASIVFGLALSVASTVMLTRVLMDNHDLKTPTGRIAIGWLVVEDIFTVVVLVSLPTLFDSTSGHSLSISRALILTTVKLVVLVVVAFAIGSRLIPKVLNSIAATRSNELFTLTVLVLALGIAVGSALVFGVSMALGAFLAGMIVGQSEFSFRAASDALPMRDAFAVLFFVSVGMLLDPYALLQSPGLILATLAIVLIGKPLVAFLIVAFAGYSSKIALGVAVALAQIGEFSLILATLGDKLQLLPAGTTNLIVATTLVSLTLNPILYRSTRLLETALVRSNRLWLLLNRKSYPAGIRTNEAKPAELHRALIVGYGPIGRTVGRLLQGGNIESVVVDTNLENTRRARTDGYSVVYGDATHPEILEAAGIGTAVALIISGPTVEQASEIIRLARKINPRVRVLSRSYYLREAAVMREAGADAVFSGEGEVARAMTQYVMDLLGANPEQTEPSHLFAREDILGAIQPESRH